MPADPTSQEHLAYVLRFHTEMAAKLCPPGDRLGFIFGSLCSAAGIEGEDFSRLLDLVKGATTDESEAIHGPGNGLGNTSKK